MASSDGGHAEGICPIRATQPARRVPCEQCPLRSTAICSELDDTALAELGRVCTLRRLPARRIVAMEGDPVDFGFVFASGAAKIYKSLADGRTQITGFLLPGDFYGLPGHDSLPFTLETTRPSELRAFPMEILETLFTRYPGLDRNFHAWMCHELTAEQEHVLLLGCKTANERLASFLLLYDARWARVPAGESDGFELVFGRRDLAGYLGLSVETVSRAFTRLRKDDLIALPSSAHVIT